MPRQACCALPVRVMIDFVCLLIACNIEVVRTEKCKCREFKLPAHIQKTMLHSTPSQHLWAILSIADETIGSGIRTTTSYVWRRWWRSPFVHIDQDVDRIGDVDDAIVITIGNIEAPHRKRRRTLTKSIVKDQHRIGDVDHIVEVDVPSFQYWHRG